MSDFEFSYDARTISYLDQWDMGDWKMKVYGIAYGAGRPGRPLIRAARLMAERRLQEIDSTLTTYGVGFIGIHEGKTSNFVFIDWWAEENELHHHVYVSPLDAPAQLVYQTPSGLTACVWDLRVLSFEREAWVANVLINPQGYDLGAYLDAQLNETV